MTRSEAMLAMCKPIQYELALQGKCLTSKYGVLDLVDEFTAEHDERYVYLCMDAEHSVFIYYNESDKKRYGVDIYGRAI